MVSCGGLLEWSPVAAANWQRCSLPLHGTQALNEDLFIRVFPGGAELSWPHTLVSLPFSLRARDSGFLDVSPAMLVTTEGWG